MILDAFQLNGKTALVTGASRGLGKGMALALAQAGADIIGADLGDMTLVQSEVEAMGRKFLAIQGDLSDMKFVEKIVEKAEEQFSKIDILVNNAGIIRRNDVLEFTEKDWDDVMNLNIKSLFFLSQRVAKLMAKNGKGGKIISVASMLSFQGGIRVPSYTASKSGVKGLTMLLANELAQFNIQANAIAPGYMATDNTEALRKDEKRNTEILDRIPAGRWGMPDDLAGAAVFLASAASNYVTGHTLVVDGGWLAR